MLHASNDVNNDDHDEVHSHQHRRVAVEERQVDVENGNGHHHHREETTEDSRAGPQSPLPPMPTAYEPTSVVAHTTAVTSTPVTKFTSPDEPPEPTNAKKQTTRFSHMQKKINVIPSNRKGQLNTPFLSTLSGVLKLAEVVLTFVSFILAICSDRRSTGAAWTEHISYETMIVVTTFLILYVVFPHCSLHNEQTREGLLIVELLFYGINTVFYFIGIWLMIHLSASWGVDGRGAAVMDAILCVALTLVFAVETFLKFKTWRSGPSASATNDADSFEETTRRI